MWATDELTSEEAERVRLVVEATLRISDARRRPGEGRAARGWRWRIEPGMEEAFEDLQGWFLPSQREAIAETVALAQGAPRIEVAASLGGPDQSRLLVGWPLPACCAPKRGHRTRDTGLVVTGPGLSCCAP